MFPRISYLFESFLSGFFCSFSCIKEFMRHRLNGLTMDRIQPFSSLLGDLSFLLSTYHLDGSNIGQFAHESFKSTRRFFEFQIVFEGYLYLPVNGSLMFDTHFHLLNSILPKGTSVCLLLNFQNDNFFLLLVLKFVI